MSACVDIKKVSFVLRSLVLYANSDLFVVDHIYLWRLLSYPIPSNTGTTSPSYVTFTGSGISLINVPHVVRFQTSILSDRAK